MTYQLRTPENYTKKLHKFLKTHPELSEAYKKTIRLLSANPYHPSLRLHRLSGNLKDFYSVSINLKYRITIDFIIENDLIILVDITNHYEK